MRRKTEEQSFSKKSLPRALGCSAFLRPWGPWLEREESVCASGIPPVSPLLYTPEYIQVESPKPVYLFAVLLRRWSPKPVLPPANKPLEKIKSAVKTQSHTNTESPQQLLTAVPFTDIQQARQTHIQTRNLAVYMYERLNFRSQVTVGVSLRVILTCQWLRPLLKLWYALKLKT